VKYGNNAHMLLDYIFIPTKIKISCNMKSGNKKYLR